MVVEILKKLVKKRKLKNQTSIAVNPEIINKFLNKPDFPWLISFPRTGSHWLRMLMELYFEKPSLVRIFYYKKAVEFTCYHRHDEDLTIQGCQNVIYLYRNPVDTIYSQMRYYNEDMDDINRVLNWTNLYGQHLKKWLFEENYSKKKTILTYERMIKDLDSEFEKVCQHFNYPFLLDKFSQVKKKVTKEKLKIKTLHDKKVVDFSKNYSKNRNYFKKNYSSIIIGAIKKNDERLCKCITQI
ncbi:MAG: sulfotransferase domain-containing protein [Deltaproteobacteria bacterium]|jgi:hypothetical protein|nr:sulfotransferase domain-containing protein [Deltaproteobacteria bacterium]